MKDKRAIENKIKELEKRIEKTEELEREKGPLSRIGRDCLNKVIAKAEALEWVLNDGSLFTDL